MSGPDRRLAHAHARARERGVSPVLYGLARAILTPALRAWFRVEVSGREHIPPQGATIVAPNHKSFADAFFVGIAIRRHVRFMAKAELFRGPLGRLVVRLGAFPVRRGEADLEALETARAILGQGGVLVVFPEGTRVDEPDALGSPHHGAGRLAVETGAPIVPTAIAGTARLWLGPVPKPRRVRVAFLDPVLPTGTTATRDALAELIDGEVWPAVQREYGRLVATPGPIVGVLGALGLAGGFVARRQRAQRPTRLLGVVEVRRLRRSRARRRWRLPRRRPRRRLRR